MFAGECGNYSISTACAVRPPSFARPPSAPSSMKTDTPTTCAPRRSARSAAAFAVPPGRQHVVHDQDALALAERVRVHLETVLPVLEPVGHALGRARQLAGLARRDDADVELAREHRAEEKPARLDAEHLLGARAAKRLRHRAGRRGERLGRREQRRHVAKEDSGAREVRHVADVRAEVGHRVISKEA